MFALICHFRILAAFSVWFAGMYLVPVDEQTWEKFGFFPGIIILIMTHVVGLQSLQGWTDILQSQGRLFRRDKVRFSHFPRFSSYGSATSVQQIRLSISALQKIAEPRSQSVYLFLSWPYKTKQRTSKSCEKNFPLLYDTNDRTGYGRRACRRQLNTPQGFDHFNTLRLVGVCVANVPLSASWSEN